MAEHSDMTQSQWLTPKDLSELLSVGKDRAYELCRLNGFPAIKLGASYRINPSLLNKWLAENIGNEISF